MELLWGHVRDKAVELAWIELYFGRVRGRLHTLSIEDSLGIICCQWEFDLDLHMGQDLVFWLPRASQREAGRNGRIFRRPSNKLRVGKGIFIEEHSVLVLVILDWCC